MQIWFCRVFSKKKTNFWGTKNWCRKDNSKVPTNGVTFGEGLDGFHVWMQLITQTIHSLQKSELSCILVLPLVNLLLLVHAQFASRMRVLNEPISALLQSLTVVLQGLIRCNLSLFASVFYTSLSTIYGFFPCTNLWIWIDERRDDLTTRIDTSVWGEADLAWPGTITGLPNCLQLFCRKYCRPLQRKTLVENTRTRNNWFHKIARAVSPGARTSATSLFAVWIHGMWPLADFFKLYEEVYEWSKLWRLCWYDCHGLDPS